MGVHVVWNTLTDPWKNREAERAVREVLDERPDSEHWDVKLTESAAIPGWVAVIVCPNREKVAWYFHGCDEDDSPQAVRSRVIELLKAVGYV